MLKFENRSLFLCVWTLGARFYYWNLKLGAYFLCVWPQILKNWSEPDLWKIKELDFHVKIWNWKPILCVSEHWEQNLNFQRSQIYWKSRSQIFVVNFETGSLFFVRLNTGSQFFEFWRAWFMKNWFSY